MARLINPRLFLITGALGLPMLILGMLSLNLRLCLAGAVVSGCSAVVYALLLLRPE